ncbi:Nucleolar protein 12, partial [Ascosphaera aggregata]
MGKKSSSKSDRDSAPATVALPFLAKSNDVAFDPTLTSLFEQSAGPVQTPSFLHVKEFLSEKKFTKRRSEEDEEAAVSSDESSVQGESEDQDEDENGSDVSSMTDASDAEAERKDDALPVLQEPGRKRKRKSKEEETLEDAYFKKLAQRELKDDDEAKKVGAKRRKVVAPLGEEDSASSSDGDGETVDEEGELDSDSNTPLPPPVHETISKDHEKAALDRSQRTIFVSNVSIEAIKSKSAKKALMAHFSSFIPSLPKADVTHKIESIRFRSVAFSDTSLPKRAAYAKKEIMDSTTQSTNAYVVYSTHAAARKAPAVLNGSIVLGRHVRVDSVAHPAPVDHKR